MSTIKELMNSIVAVDETVSKHDIETSSSNWINDNGVYAVTIDKAFISQTKKKGLQLDLHFNGANSFTTTLYRARPPVFIKCVNKLYLILCPVIGCPAQLSTHHSILTSCSTSMLQN